jgi:hypothetical protein
MAHTAASTSKREEAKQHAKQGAKQGADEASPWVRRLGRFGYATKGIVYAIVGVLAAQAAFGTGGRTTGSSGALQEIVSQPFGRWLLGIVAVGLVGYALWRLVQAAMDTERKGSDPKGIGARLSYAVSGVIYGGLAWTAVQIVMGTGGGGSGGGGGGSSTQHWTAQLMAQPFGRWLVALVGIGVIGFGLYQIYKGIAGKFRKKLSLPSMSDKEEKAAVTAGRVGLPARGIVVGMIGAFLLQAAWQAQPSEAKGLGSSLQELVQQPFGPWLLGIVAIGLIAYGVFMGFMARYRRFNLPSSS